MTDDDVIAGLWLDSPGKQRLLRVLAAVRAEATLAEREACAKVAYDEIVAWGHSGAGIVAAAIRARSAPSPEPTKPANDGKAARVFFPTSGVSEER